MPKFYVYGTIEGSVYLGQYEAETKEEAIKLAEEDDTVDWYTSICSQCSDNLTIGGIGEVFAEEA